MISDAMTDKKRWGNIQYLDELTEIIHCPVD